MIKCDKGASEIKGVIPDIMAEYSCITEHLITMIRKDELMIELGVDAEDFIKQAFRWGVESAQREKAIKDIEGILAEVRNRYGDKDCED